MSLLNYMGCKKQNVHSQTWTKFLRFFQVFMYFRNKFSKKRNIKISVKCSRFVSSIYFENRFISYISEQYLFRILTGKKHHQTKLQCLQKIRIRVFGSLVHQINLLWEVLKLKWNFQKNKVVTGKTMFFVIGWFCTHHSICLKDTHREKLFYSVQYMNSCLTASDLFHMFIQLSSVRSIITY